MKTLTKSEFISFLYAEKDRETTNNSIPGWNNWALAISFITILFFVYDNLKTTYQTIDWLSVLSFAYWLLILILTFEEISNITSFHTRSIDSSKIRRLWDEAPVLKQFILLFTFASIATLLAFSKHSDKVTFYIYTLALIEIGTIIYLIINRNKLVTAEFKTKTISNQKSDAIFKGLRLMLYINILIHGCAIFCNLNNKFNEFELALGLLGVWTTIYIFLRINYTSSSYTTSKIDLIIDKFIYGNLSQEEAYSQLTQLRHGNNSLQAMREELRSFYAILKIIPEKNTYLDNIVEDIKNEEVSYEQYKTLLSSIITDSKDYTNAIHQSKRVVKKLDAIAKLNNNATLTVEYITLLDSIKSEFTKIEKVLDKSQLISRELTEYSDKYKCRKFGGLCENMECENRRDKMSILYIVRLFTKRTLNRIYTASQNIKK